MNFLSREQLKDIRRRYEEKGRLLVTNHELGDLLYMVEELLQQVEDADQLHTQLKEAYARDIAKFDKIKAIVEEGVNYGPVG